MLGSLPTHSQPCQTSPNRLSTDSVGCQSLLKAYLGGQSQRPQASGLAKAPGTVVQQLPQSFYTLSIERGTYGMRAGGESGQAVQAFLVEGFDGIPYRLVVTAQAASDLGCPFPPGASQDDLATPEDEGVW